MVSTMKFLIKKILLTALLFSIVNTKLEASPHLFSKQNCVELFNANALSPTPFLSSEELECIECEEIPFFSRNAVALAWNLAQSQLGFFAINIFLFHQELLWGKIDLQTLFAISSVEIAKNLVNYVLIENSAQTFVSILSVVVLNSYRSTLKIPKQERYPPLLMDIIVAIAEYYKGRVNFKITENTFPSEWSAPPHLHDEAEARNNVREKYLNCWKLK